MKTKVHVIELACIRAERWGRRHLTAEDFDYLAANYEVVTAHGEPMATTPPLPFPEWVMNLIGRAVEDGTLCLSSHEPTENTLFTITSKPLMFA